MATNLFDRNVVSMLKTAQDSELHLAGLYADIAKKITDPTLQALIYSMVGDAYGHFRILAVALIADLQIQRDNRQSKRPLPYSKLT